MKINELIYEAHRMAVEKGWWEKDRSPGECIALMHSELSEALEEIRKPQAPMNENWIGEGGKPEGVPAELADTIIRIADFCGRHNIDLESAIAQKMAFNSTRPHRHGGRIL